MRVFTPKLKKARVFFGEKNVQAVMINPQGNSCDVPVYGYYLDLDPNIKNANGFSSIQFDRPWHHVELIE